MTQHLTLDIPGATPGEIQRGLQAAQQVLDDAGVPAFRAAWNAWIRDQWEFEINLPHDDAAAELWCTADHAALQACCQGWAKLPSTACLGLTPAYRDEMAHALADEIAAYQEAVRRRNTGSMA